MVLWVELRKNGNERKRSETCIEVQWEKQTQFRKFEVKGKHIRRFFSFL